MALWQRCVHLGCRVPECASSQGFECPCHGSKYNYHGEYEDGPAPRNLDRFVVTVNDAGELIIDTGQVIQTATSHHQDRRVPPGAVMHLMRGALTWVSVPSSSASPSCRCWHGWRSSLSRVGCGAAARPTR